MEFENYSQKDLKFKIYRICGNKYLKIEMLIFLNLIIFLDGKEWKNYQSISINYFINYYSRPKSKYANLGITGFTRAKRKSKKIESVE